VRRYHRRIQAILAIALLVLAACVPPESGGISVHFCPAEDCPAILARFISDAQGPACALYGVTEPLVIEALRAADARVVVDHGAGKLPFPAREFRKPGLMHNKFCVAGDRIITGSYNPTRGDAANALIILRSARLARAYRTEFEELWQGMERGPATRKPGTAIDGAAVRVAFCPDDGCQEAVLDTLDAAEESIRFMLYSFTDDRIGDLLARKAHEGILIGGLLDTSQVSKHSEADKLGGRAAILPGIHHKTFIIDGTTVITGSYNPTRSGTERNDENLLIIRDRNIAAAFTAEFERLQASVS
jgi:phosphatidylserine/phosphatidylglycerophosphate/cardiolipin synthase-like enzyme